MVMFVYYEKLDPVAPQIFCRHFCVVKRNWVVWI